MVRSMKKLNKYLCKAPVLLRTAPIMAGYLIMTASPAHADLTALFGKFANDIEERSAVATQAVYDQLKTAGCSDLQAGPTQACAGGTYLVWRNVREVVHNANVLTGATEEPTNFSLGRPSVALLGRALRWCNGEEFSSMGSLSNSFVNSQVGSLAARITALRFGASGFRLAGSSFGDSPQLAQVGSRGGAAGADSWSRLGGFINVSYNDGDKDLTSREDAFSFDGRSINAGFDFRIDANWVAGVMLGYQNQDLDFDTTATVEAKSKMHGVSLLPFILYQSDAWYASASLGYQRMNFDLNRHVNYGSGALAAVAVQHNTVDDSGTDANSFTSYNTVGYSFSPSAPWTIEPSLSIDYQHIAIDGFTERDVQNQGFNFAVDKQIVQSLEAIPAVRAQYAFKPSYGVWVPFVDAQWHTQFKNDSRNIKALYADAGGLLTDAAQFEIATDALDKHYWVYTVGLSAVLRGAAPHGTEVAAGGLQAFVNYRWYEGMENYSQQVVSAGLRYEF
ncbi:MAG: autotransporter outer rane beta-barrel protein [Verrucomicrobiaceae bacterium]|nr:autotransporter outer rane beta-barrel protein [Verrucomicrobiaceae bacterium]